MAAHSRRRFLRHAATAASATCVAPAILARPSPKGNVMKSSEAMEDASRSGADRSGVAGRPTTTARWPRRRGGSGRPDAWCRGWRSTRNACASIRGTKKRRESVARGAGEGTESANGSFSFAEPSRTSLEDGPRGMDRAPFSGLSSRPRSTARSAPRMPCAASRHWTRPPGQRELAGGSATGPPRTTRFPRFRRRRSRPRDAVLRPRIGVPVSPDDGSVLRGNITDRLTPLDAFPPFLGGRCRGSVGDPGRFRSDRPRLAAVYRQRPPGTVITLLHGFCHGRSPSGRCLPYVSRKEAAKVASATPGRRGPRSLFGRRQGRRPRLSTDALPSREELRIAPSRTA